MKKFKEWFIYIVLIISVVFLARLVNKQLKASHQEAVEGYLAKIDSLETHILTIETLSIPTADTVVRMEDVVQEISKYNWRFPEIILAQFVLESAEFNSNVARNNNNIAGMKVAKQRLTNARKHPNNSYALYDNYKECVVDRALYEAVVLRGAKTETEYYNILNRSYAEDGKYVNKLKKIIKDYKLKEMF